VFHPPARLRALEALQSLALMKASTFSTIALHTDRALAELICTYPTGKAVEAMTEEHVRTCGLIGGRLLKRFAAGGAAGGAGPAAGGAGSRAPGDALLRSSIANLQRGHGLMSSANLELVGREKGLSMVI